MKVKAKEHQKRCMYIAVNYPIIYALLKSNPPGLSSNGWKAIYKELQK
jgi:hypothetical protein|tara:strand:+ start:554 stop:697 length:144 start_codon:yes stop_codon:yes gene_type:complete